MQTDTASVLMEAIGYIKFLQDQVEVCNNAHLPEIIQEQQEISLSCLLGVN
jgi:hypothetical protein